MKNLVRKFPTNKMERNDTSWEYNNEILFKYKLFMYFLRSSRRNFRKVSFASFTEFSFVCHLRHLNDGNFFESFINIEIFNELLSVGFMIWWTQFDISFWLILKSSKNLRKLEKVIWKKKPIKQIQSQFFFNRNFPQNIFVCWANRQNIFVLKNCPPKQKDNKELFEWN